MPTLAAVTTVVSALPLFTFSLHSFRLPANTWADHRICWSVTDKGADSAEILPAASKAETVKEHGTPGDSSVIDADVLPGEAARGRAQETREQATPSSAVAAHQE